MNMESLIVKWLRKRKRKKFIHRALLWKDFLAKLKSVSFTHMKNNGCKHWDHSFDVAWMSLSLYPEYRNLPLSEYKSHCYQWCSQEWVKDRKKVKKIADLKTRYQRLKDQYGVTEIKERKLP